LKLTMAVFWVDRQCRLAEISRRYRSACCFHPQGSSLYKAQQPGRQSATFTHADVRTSNLNHLNSFCTTYKLANCAVLNCVYCTLLVTERCWNGKADCTYSSEKWHGMERFQTTPHEANKAPLPPE
jgi:hypothetical protein